MVDLYNAISLRQVVPLGAIGPETSEAVVLSEILGEVGPSAAEAVAEDMAEALQKYVGVTPDTRVLGAGGG